MLGIAQTGMLQLTLKIVLSVLIFLAIGCLCGLIVILIRRRLVKEIKQDSQIMLKNLGNVPSVFHLTVESLESLLHFTFLQDGIPLPEIVEVLEVPSAPEIVPSPIDSSSISEGKRVTAENKNVPAKIDKKTPAAVKVDNKAADNAIAKTGALSSLLGVVGSILPGSLGKSLKEKGLAVRDVQTKTKDATEKPKELQRKMDAVQKDSGKLGVKTSSSRPQTPGTTVTSEKNQPVSKQQTLQSGSKSYSKSTTQTLKYFCTNEVNPGESLSLSLRIGTRNYRIPNGTSLYTIHSQQVPSGNFDKEIPIVTKQGFVSFSPVSKWHYWYAWILAALLVVAGVAAEIYFISLLWA